MARHELPQRGVHHFTLRAQSAETLSLADQVVARMLKMQEVQEPAA